MARATARGGLLPRFSLAALSTAAALLAGECALRAAGVAPTRYAAVRQVENADKSAGVDAYPSDPRGYFDLDLRDAATRARLAARGLAGLERLAERTPHAVGFEYNRDRCRDRAPGPRAPGVARVVLIGDSFTEGEGVREADTFARRLERALRAEGRAVEVFNCGRRGRDFPALYDERFALALRYQPDVVLYAMVLNDPVQSPEFRARQGYLNDWILDRRRMAGEGGGGSFWESRALALVRDRLDAARVGRETTRWYREMFGPANAAGWAQTRGYFGRMAAEARARGATFAMALLPLLVGLEGEYPFGDASRAVAQAARDAGVPFRDVLPALRGRPSASLWVHPVDMHPNEVAHARIAADLLPLVREALSARREPREPPGPPP